MSKTKSGAPQSADGPAAAPQDPPTYRNNPEVDARIDAYIQENPRFWVHVQAMPRDRLERTVALNEIRQLDRQERMREGVLKQIGRDPERRRAYDLLVKDIPEEQREAVIAQMDRQTRRAIGRSRHQQETQGEGVSV